MVKVMSGDSGLGWKEQHGFCPGHLLSCRSTHLASPKLACQKATLSRTVLEEGHGHARGGRLLRAPAGRADDIRNLAIPQPNH